MLILNMILYIMMFEDCIKWHFYIENKQQQTYYIKTKRSDTNWKC